MDERERRLAQCIREAIQARLGNCEEIVNFYNMLIDVYEQEKGA